MSVGCWVRNCFLIRFCLEIHLLVCATCHKPQLAFADDQATTPGIEIDLGLEIRQVWLTLDTTHIS